MLKEAIREYGFLMADGAMATELESMGHDLSSNLWSAKVLLENEAAIMAVHRSYLAAGSNILTTATYQATYQRLLEYGYSEVLIDQLFERSIQWGRQVIAANDMEHPTWIAASIGPYGAFLADGSEYTGKYTLSVKGLIEFHNRRFQRIVSTRPDLIAFETIPCLKEVEAICELLSAEKLAKAWVSLSCLSGEQLASGEQISAAINMLSNCAQVVAVGGNCIAPELVTSIIQTIRAHTFLPIIIYPNSGELWDAKQRCWVTDAATPPLADYVKEWFHAGANIFGGCCRTKPEDIRKMKSILNRIKV